MKIIKTPHFERAAQKLPQQIQRLLYQQELRFRQNPFDPRLHRKKVHGGDYSFRVTRNYRVLFHLQDYDTAVWYIIDHRKDIYR